MKRKRNRSNRRGLPRRLMFYGEVILEGHCWPGAVYCLTLNSESKCYWSIC